MLYDRVYIPGAWVSSRICCLSSIIKALPPSARRADTVQALTYIAQKLLGADLGYRFRWTARGPYSRRLSSDLRRAASECVCGDGLNVKAVAELIRRLSGARVGLETAIKVLAAYLMLSTDVYPKPQDVIKEVSRVFGLSEHEVTNVVSQVGEYLRVHLKVEA